MAANLHDPLSSPQPRLVERPTFVVTTTYSEHRKAPDEISAGVCYRLPGAKSRRPGKPAAVGRVCPNGKVSQVDALSRRCVNVGGISNPSRGGVDYKSAAKLAK